MLMMFEKKIRGGMYNAMCRYVKGNNKYMNNYNNISKNIKIIY